MAIVGTWTYGGDPATSNLDLVRWLTGLTNSDDKRISDEEIAAALASEGTAEAAGARVLRAHAASLTGQPDMTVGDLTISMAALADGYAKRAAELETAGGGSVAAGPRTAATTKAGKSEAESDTDRVPGYFSRGMHDDAATGPDTDR